ncbi:hypothetical protein SLA2020_517380 [Shorea laevis]
MKILCSDPPSSADTIAGNKDLLTEILLRLPPKPLVRFRSVSKDWCSLISSPRFCHRHARLSPAPKISGIFFRKSAADFHYLSLNSDNLSPNPFKFLDFAQDPAGIRILQSCNGLLLCSSFFKIGFTRNYYVCNPTTGRFSTIPPIIGDVSAVVSGFNLAFEPSKSPYYKLICVRSAAGSVGCHQIEIYSSETGDWKLCGSPFVAPFDMVFNNGVFCNGSIHWISPTGSPMYFDVSNERIGMLPTVPIVEQQSTRRFRYFGESGGHLHLIEIYGPRTTQFRVLEMEKDYSKWVVREEKEEDSSLLLHIPDKIISFNIRKKTFRELCHLSGNSSVNGKGRHSMQFGWLDAYQYFESLACP